MDYQRNDQDCRHICLCVTSLAILLTQHTVDLYMAKKKTVKNKTTKNKAIKKERSDWSTEETGSLVNYLHQHKSEAGDGGLFQTMTYHNAAMSIVHLYNQESGPKKTKETIKTKWMNIETYCGLSGCHWDPTRGCGIEGPGAEAAFHEYTKVYTVPSPSHTTPS
ncbi:hypothetical protein HYDPIDRAFT_170609 [Hydnomerulius pinastri MD-312]|uniref:Myb/SANT-like domain-containing protein n=1 Tax=Hydnomerulius pinastri MD-312 TaxID=994086 RepID=A0A0C9VQ47_9AGAM|nr:hypothetical protein HYDPIDRAFT_170609 [Hydnomerulius pinastri MD-312]